MDLGKHVIDKELLDRNGLRAGKVDDLILEIGEPEPDGTLPLPKVVSIVSGPMALATSMSRPTRWIAKHLYELLGLHDPRPVIVPWLAITEMGVTIDVDIDRDHEGMSALATAVNRRFIDHIPGS